MEYEGILYTIEDRLATITLNHPENRNVLSQHLLAEFTDAVNRIRQDEEVGALVLETEGLRITCAPVEHLVPTVGLRFENKRSGGYIAYSSDTAPCDAVVSLAQGADVLIHEAASNTPGHTSAAQAGEIARRAGVGRLVLIHYRPDEKSYASWLARAEETFGGPVELARDLAEYLF